MTRGNQSGSAAQSRAFGRHHFGVHAACAHSRACATSHGFQFWMVGSDFFNKLSIGIFARVAVVQAALVGEYQQRVGFNQIGYQCAQSIVVAEFDFIGGDGVVFIDDGHHIPIEQGAQSRTRIQIAHAVAQVFMSKQNLRGLNAKFGKHLFIRLRQTHLADGSSGL